VKLIYLEETDSTNRFAANLLKEETPEEGTVIQAAFQTAGRGQRGNSWYSSKGENLLFSIVFYPDFLFGDQQFYLSKMISVGLFRFFNSFCNDVKIKWPNDIYFQNKKIGGILIENSLQGSEISHSIVGVGLNINQQIFPDQIPNPISLFQITNKKYDLQELLQQAVHHIFRTYEELAEGNFAAINNAYIDALFRFQEIANFKTPEGETFSGKIVDVKENGCLQIETNFRKKLFYFKEIEFLMP